MKRLIGEWHGTGIATFPTIETATYREILTVVPHRDDSILKVEQQTWRIHPDNTESLLYWECGFLRQLSPATCEWINAQNNGRAEVLHGEISDADPDILRLNLKSSVFANDERMLASTRSFEVAKDTLSYSMAMATQAHPTLQQHLAARLTRQ